MQAASTSVTQAMCLGPAVNLSRQENTLSSSTARPACGARPGLAANLETHGRTIVETGGLHFDTTAQPIPPSFQEISARGIRTHEIEPMYFPSVD